jgi:hypothetical protein
MIMIEVRLRHEDDARAVHLFEWDPADLDGAVRTLMDVGVRDSGGNQYAGREHFTSEVVYEDGEAFLEIVFGFGVA